MEIKMKTKKLLYTTLASALVLSMTTGSVQAKETIRLSTYVNETDIRYDGFKKFAELASQKSNGNLDIQIFPSSTLHGWSEGVDAVQGGVADISWIPADNRLACYRVTSLYPAEIDLENQNELDAQYSDLMRSEAAKVGLIPLFNSNYSYDQEWWFETPVSKLNDLDGKLVRSIGPLVSSMIEAWGGKPVFVSPNEVFQSAERGVVDGINMGVATYSSWKLWDVMPHMVNANLFYGNIIYMMNESKFESLSKSNQTVLLEAAKETEIWLKPRYEDWVDQRVGNAVMKNGGSVTTISKKERHAIIESAQSSWDEVVDDACGKPLADKVRKLFAKHAK
jgi:TRAP-type C4-dicarboxylate transport system substrate-binding protein